MPAVARELDGAAGAGAARDTVEVVESSREWRYRDRRGGLSWVGNLFWLVACGGLGVALVYYAVGAVFLCTVVLSPFGMQLFKLGSLALFPFGRKVVNVVADEDSGMMLASDAGCFEPCCCVQDAPEADVEANNHRGGCCCGCCDCFCCGCGCCSLRRACNCCGRGLLFLASLVWLPVGLALAIVHLALGIGLCVTVIGIPFGLQHFKLARLALCPFGKLDDNGIHPVETIVQTVRREPVYEAIPVGDEENAISAPTQTFAEPLVGQRVSHDPRAEVATGASASASHRPSAPRQGK